MFDAQNHVAVFRCQCSATLPVGLAVRSGEVHLEPFAGIEGWTLDPKPNHITVDCACGRTYKFQRSQPLVQEQEAPE